MSNQISTVDEYITTESITKVIVKDSPLELLSINDDFGSDSNLENISKRSVNTCWDDSSEILDNLTALCGGYIRNKRVKI